MKRLVLAAATLTLLSAAPALAMSCCGGGKAGQGMMCGKGAMAMSQGKGMKAKKGCCEGMTGGSRRRA